MNKRWLLLLLGLVLAGCGGGAAARPPTQPSDDGVAKSAPDRAPAPPPQATASQPGFAAAESSSVHTSGGRSSDAPRSPTPEPEARRDSSADSRPGLGTEWGEARTSRVHDVSFVRDSNRPFATATLHYNDRKGVEALANLQANRETRRDVPAGGGAVTITVRDASGEPLEAVHVGDRTLIVGQAGQRYSIVLVNHTSHRFEAITTVDGLDVVNGKPGSFDNRGYVLLPFATLEIEGFRQSSSSVAAFRFGAVGDSYAAQMGSARNVGVIGVALFGERGDSFVPESELRLRDTASPFPADPRFAQPPPRR